MNRTLKVAIQELRTARDTRVSKLLVAASNGSTSAAYQLACLCHHAGDSPSPILKGTASAIKYARIALKGGCAWAGTLLGHIYSDKSSQYYCRSKAMRYYLRAGMLGHDYASEELDKLKAKGKWKRENRGRRKEFDKPKQR